MFSHFSKRSERPDVWRKMPTYEYECQKCGLRFELFQSMKDKPRQRCPECRGKVTRCIGTGAGIIFKGSGFYSTDYRSPTYHAAAKNEKAAPAPSGGETKSSGKAEKSNATNS